MRSAVESTFYGCSQFVVWGRDGKCVGRIRINGEKNIMEGSRRNSCMCVGYLYIYTTYLHVHAEYRKIIHFYGWNNYTTLCLAQKKEKKNRATYFTSILYIVTSQRSRLELRLLKSRSILSYRGTDLVVINFFWVFQVKRIPKIKYILRSHISALNWRTAF